MSKNGNARIITGCLDGEGCEITKPLRPEAKEHAPVTTLKKRAHLRENLGVIEG
jgi:hypothetical protein